MSDFVTLLVIGGVVALALAFRLLMDSTELGEVWESMSKNKQWAEGRIAGVESRSVKAVDLADTNARIARIMAYLKLHEVEHPVATVIEPIPEPPQRARDSSRQMTVTANQLTKAAASAAKRARKL